MHDGQPTLSRLAEGLLNGSTTGRKLVEECLARMAAISRYLQSPAFSNPFSGSLDTHERAGSGQKLTSFLLKNEH